ncbi:MAG: acyl carrier protein [Clostridia bacterium]|nr:acyl carrier protein [Clostridia bacterium]
MQNNVFETIKSYLLENIVNEDIDLDYDLNLMNAGIIDSITMVKVILFLEHKFQVRFAEEDLLPDHFETINTMGNFIKTKIQ